MSRKRDRIWPSHFRYVGEMIDRSVIVRVGCARCRNFFDVDLRAIVLRRGREYCLIDRTVQCKMTSCRGTGYFFAAYSMTTPLITLINPPTDPLLVERRGLRPIDIEPPVDPGSAPAVSAAKCA